MPCVFGFVWGEIFIFLPFLVCSESVVIATAVPGGRVLLGSMEEVLMLPFLFDLISSFNSSLFFLSAVRASGFTLALSCSIIINMSLSTNSFLSNEAISRYSG